MQRLTRRHWLSGVSPLLAAPILAQDAQPKERRNASNAAPTTRVTGLDLKESSLERARTSACRRAK